MRLLESLVESQRTGPAQAVVPRVWYFRGRYGRMTFLPVAPRMSALCFNKDETILQDEGIGHPREEADPCVVQSTALLAV